MEVSYRRHFDQSYMIVRGDTEPDETYELSVLSYNRIPGLLPMETEIADGVVRFWYNITGKHTLSDYLERKQVDSELLKLLFRSMDVVLKELSAYLLEERHILLKQEYLYLDFAHKSMEFVYLPGLKGDLRQSFQELMEQLLRRLNHSDKLASAMAYEMYQQSLSREEAFVDMLGKVLTEAHSAEGPTGGEEGPLSVDAFSGVDGLSGMDGFSGAEETARRERVVKGEQLTSKDPVPTIERAAVREWNLNSLPGGREHREPEAGKGIRGKLGILRKNLPGRSAAKSEESSSMEPPAELYMQPTQEVPEVGQTEVLALNQPVQGILRYQGEENRPDIRIGLPVVLIGKKEADLCIPGKSVSRIHARIEQAEGEYYLEDLNSTNGTFLNGELLEYRQKVKLSPRDRITFGLEEYVFI